MKEHYTNITELDVDLKLEILNRLNQLKNTTEALGFLILAECLILGMYIVTKGF